MENAIKVFKSQGIPVLEPGRPKYDRAIATANFLYRFSRPGCVAQPESAAHVQTIIKEAKSRNLKITIKCRGHSYAGHSTASEGISLDLRKMKEVKLDMKENTVTFDAGCQWGHVYGTLINGQHKGFVINGGRCPTVGVSGFLLGGGLSPFTRSFGMGSDTLMEADVVTADGKLITVKETDNPKSDKGKLFWALCGAGGGNFGVVVRLKLRVQKLRNQDGTVVAGRYQWFPKAGFTEDIISTMIDFYTTDWPNEITIDTTWICDLRQSAQLGGIRFAITFDGSKADYDGIIDKYIKNEELKVQLKRRVLAESSTRFLYETLVNQWLEETERAYPANKTYELYSSFMFTKDNKGVIQKAIAIVRDLMASFRADFKGEQVNFLVTWIHSGGKAIEKKPTDSAFFWREAVFHTYITVEWVDKWMERDMRRFLTTVKDALRPLSLNGEAAFINFPDSDSPIKSYERAYFGGNFEELRRVKQIWDKDNFFKWAQGVRLPGEAEGNDGEGEGADKTDQIASEQWEYYKTTDIVKDLNELADLGY
ncbi:hypothetical protein PC9H_005157 [Pleurotus ostreatus]|uniref:FAD-binding PCMH-type domain-containing protein n=2 Tax=Pleurotus ostreatus TaxID=5322 RepID=A0A067NM81_PLEO1|nr:uncharacterized protein PC9H_005157 [Pleurotus ostreatus]KAF7433207.1 hypothetical protein PC9H_005157 [Pleurotus ostreatus]KAJ8698145.1 hypothetical protein PTI98_004883 [Pleurotus ostreatus]KDQ29188.1 hypothetical protein PLEOSDRAFT_1083002 [Pleurotus ostreatus PC15]